MKAGKSTWTEASLLQLKAWIEFQARYTALVSYYKILGVLPFSLSHHYHSPFLPFLALFPCLFIILYLYLLRNFLSPLQHFSHRSGLPIPHSSSPEHFSLRVFLSGLSWQSLIFLTGNTALHLFRCSSLGASDLTDRKGRWTKPWVIPNYTVSVLVW